AAADAETAVRIFLQGRFRHEAEQSLSVLKIRAWTYHGRSALRVRRRRHFDFVAFAARTVPVDHGLAVHVQRAHAREVTAADDSAHVFLVFIPAKRFDDGCGIERALSEPDIPHALGTSERDFISKLEAVRLWRAPSRFAPGGCLVKGTFVA